MSYISPIPSHRENPMFCTGLFNPDNVFKAGCASLQLDWWTGGSAESVVVPTGMQWIDLGENVGLTNRNWNETSNNEEHLIDFRWKNVET